MKKTIFTILLIICTLNATIYTNLKTGSMPCLQNDDKVLVVECHPFESLKTGDVIAYRPTKDKLDTLGKYRELSPLAASYISIFENPPFSYNSVLFHRIVYIGGDFVIARADISSMPDPVKIGKEDYRGKVEAPKCAERRK